MFVLYLVEGQEAVGFNKASRLKQTYCESLVNNLAREHSVVALSLDEVRQQHQHDIDVRRKWLAYCARTRRSLFANTHIPRGIHAALPSYCISPHFHEQNLSSVLIE